MKKNLCTMLALAGIVGASLVSASQTITEREQTKIDIAINDALVGAMLGYIASVNGAVAVLEELSRQSGTLANQIHTIKETYSQSPRVPAMIDPLLAKLEASEKIIEESKKALKEAAALAEIWK